MKKQARDAARGKSLRSNLRPHEPRLFVSVARVSETKAGNRKRVAEGAIHKTTHIHRRKRNRILSGGSELLSFSSFQSSVRHSFYFSVRGTFLFICVAFDSNPWRTRCRRRHPGMPSEREDARRLNSPFVFVKYFPGPEFVRSGFDGWI